MRAEAGDHWSTAPGPVLNGAGGGAAANAAGGLPWRPEGGEHTHSHTDKQWVQKQKEECTEQPSRLTRSVPLPGALCVWQLG